MLSSLIIYLNVLADLQLTPGTLSVFTKLPQKAKSVGHTTIIEFATAEIMINTRRLQIIASKVTICPLTSLSDTNQHSCNSYIFKIFYLNNLWGILNKFLNSLTLNVSVLYQIMLVRCLQICFSKKIPCLNFWDEACWFLSLRFFGLLSSSLLLFPQRFGRYVLRPSLGVCRTREPSWDFELRTLLKPRGSPFRRYTMCPAGHMA